MLSFSEEQIKKLEEIEKLQYVDEVYNDINKNPELVQGEYLKERLHEAYQQAVKMGFTDGGSITQFLYLEAYMPSFYKEPLVQKWLTKPGKTPEERLSDVMQIVKYKLRDSK